MAYDDIGAMALEYVLTQHTLNKGLKIDGKQNEYATEKELKF